MKKVITIAAAAALVAFGVASSASAAGYKLSPASTKFTGTGPSSATLNGTTVGPCTTTLKGSTNKGGVGKITGGTVTGAGFCGLITFSHLPWKMVATTANTATVTGAEFTSPVGTCGTATSTLVTTLSAGTFSYNGPYGACSNLTVSFKTTPTVSIVPK
jgi:hypothetical protein